jgi:hypothetical protein
VTPSKRYLPFRELAYSSTARVLIKNEHTPIFVDLDAFIRKLI